MKKTQLQQAAALLAAQSRINPTPAQQAASRENGKLGAEHGKKGGRPPKAKAANEALAMALEVMRAQRKWMGERPVDPVAPYDISCALLIDALEIAIERAESEITKSGIIL